jgi:hypothetical protein
MAGANKSCRMTHHGARCPRGNFRREESRGRAVERAVAAAATCRALSASPPPGGCRSTLAEGVGFVSRLVARMPAAISVAVAMPFRFSVYFHPARRPGSAIAASGFRGRAPRTRRECFRDRSLGRHSPHVGSRSSCCLATRLYRRSFGRKNASAAAVSCRPRRRSGGSARQVPRRPLGAVDLPRR